MASAAAKKLDEQYEYDNLDRLDKFRRGVLDGNHTIPTSGADCARRENWGLSPTGNWNDYQIDSDGDDNFTDAADLDQDRTHNLVNEIDTNNDHSDGPDAGAITEGGGQSAWASPKYDARGNMITVPKPTALTATYTATYDAWNRLVEVKSGANVVLKCEYAGGQRDIVPREYLTRAERRY